ncbi:hypothetical protein E2I00_002049, partial [Balaenoptera physalus]
SQISLKGVSSDRNPPCTMALASSLAQLQAEASCPICLDYLRDACWEGLQDIFPCPVCLQPCPDKGIRRNSQLCHMIDFVKQLPNTRGKRKRLEEKPLCEKHKQVLSLFCETDLELLCLQCRVSSDHRHHPLAPMEQAAACHRRRLKVHIEPLKKQLEDAEKSLEMQASKSFELVRKVNNQRRELHSEVECIKHFLGTEHDEIHVRLLSSERTHSTYGNLKSPAAFSYKLKKAVFTLPPQYFGLHKMICTFQVHLTLDAETAHHSLKVSQDRKTATFRRMEPNCVHNPEAFTSHLEVLSSERFNAGRHFWQKCAYITIPKQWLLLWGSTPNTGDSGNPCRIGVFLDYELGEISFYNLKKRSPLYLFSNIFTEKLMPYFSIGPFSKSLTISSSGSPPLDIEHAQAHPRPLPVQPPSTMAQSAFPGTGLSGAGGRCRGLSKTSVAVISMPVQCNVKLVNL